MKLIATLSLCLIVLCGSAQKKKKIQAAPQLSATELAIEKIDSAIRKIQSDTSLVTVNIPSLGKELQAIFPSKKNSRLPETEDTVYTQMKAVWQNGKLVKLVLGKNAFNTIASSPQSSQILSIYFLNNKPVVLQQDFRSSVRMGSYGDVSASFYHYFNDTIAFTGQQTGSNESYASCYGWLLTKPNAAVVFKQVKELRQLLATKAPAQLPAVNSQSKGKQKFNLALVPSQFKMPKTEIEKHYGY